ncbi:efflux transporter outer membrane subunit [Croceicoccus sp. Ery15]|uniref:efflux transporter outer membrane subunit n=1 Tax=Croceicoccus sp. Ery15 TaxID=1703338 RepID=UPI001E45CBB6|nr:efflux transporter outer membrane subunit [Croceicoccus sp. Ery15]
MFRPLFPFLAGATLLSGCTVGPDYEAPEMRVSDAWIEQADSERANDAAVQPAWWDRFGDPQLSALITRAMADAPTLAEARARLAEARANRDAVLGQRLPQVSASGSATENRISENGFLPIGQFPGFDPEYGLFDLGFDASWEIDLWGRRTREGEAANARAGAAEAAYQDALVQLTGEIARSYMDLRAAQRASALAAQREEASAGLAALTGQLYLAGEASRIDAEAASAEAASAADAAAQARTAEAGAAYRLAALMGLPPENIVPELRAPAPIPDAPQDILVGLRSDLLRRRPDVRQAERELAAATAQIGVATADLFPRFSLTGGLGTQAQNAGDLFDPASTRFAIGPSFSWPVFAGGQIRARIRAADAGADAAAAAYSQSVANALSDSEGAINRFLEARKREDAAARAAAAQQQAFDLAAQRFAGGEDDRLTLEAARLDHLARQQAHATARLEAANAAVAVYKALGGAWMAEGADPAP